MAKIDYKKIINKSIVIKQLIYIFAFFLAIVTKFTDEMGASTLDTIISLVAILFFIISDALIAKIFDSKFLSIIKYFQLLIILTLEHFCSLGNLFWVVWILLSIVVGVEYILSDSMFDAMSIAGRKIIASITIMALTIYSGNLDYVWIGYVLSRIISILLILFFSKWINSTVQEYNGQISDFITKLSDYEDDNNKLKEYKNRINETNEQINLQKINLSKAYKELEIANKESIIHSEIMKHISYNYDIPKNMNYILDKIMEVKKPKLIAMYLCKDVYYNENEVLVIKTNYTSMQRRMKKEIHEIYSVFSDSNKDNIILTEEELNRYSFIGGTNMNALSIIPLIDGKKVCGMMVVISDNKDFFKTGLKFYENILMEFLSSVKNIKLYIKTQDMARKDGLTQIYNRVYFGELFEKAVKNSVSKNRPLSVALFDIDKFKSVNDTYGHLAGDEVIKMVSRIGQKYADKYGGITCRYGGEEFLLVFPEKDEKECLSILEEFHEEIRTTTVYYKQFSIEVNVCIGLSSYPNICKNPEMLINRADQSMYYGKKNGRGRLILDNSLVD